ncbi:MAG: hypothetical protein WD425_05700 [Nitrospirales bacterium]
MTLTRMILGISLSVFLFSGTGLATEPAEVGNYVKSRIEIGEMMMGYFKGGQGYGKGQRPSPEALHDMEADINAKVGAVLATHDLTIEEYSEHSHEVFADEAAVQNFLNEHPDLKARYDALPLSSMGHGRSGRGY